MGIEISARARTVKLFGQEPSLEDMARAMTELAGKQAVAMAAVQGQGALTVRLCPTMPLRFWMNRGQWAMSGQTHVAGPGAHGAAVELLDQLGERLGLRWQITDPTGYASARDFPALRAQHLAHLKQLAREMDQVDNIRERPMRFMNWPVTEAAYPVFESGVVTPMGWFDNGSLAARAWQDTEALALDLLLWPNEAMDAWYWRNRALWTMWNRLYFTRDMGREEAALAGECCRYLERAARLDGRIPLPRREYGQLCSLLGRAEQSWENPAMTGGIEIGYRKQDYCHALGSWTVTADGSLRPRHRAKNLLELRGEGRWLRVEVLAEDREGPVFANLTQQLGDVLYEARLTEDEEGGRLSGVCRAPGGCALVTMGWPAGEDERWARMTFANIRPDL